MDVPEGIAKARMSETIGVILDITNTSHYRIFLSDSKENFRLSLFPNYKANRTKQEKPTHHEALSNYIANHWNAEIAWGEEADDALGINQTDDTIICTIDKDLLQIPGKHFNWVTGNFKTISETEGLYRFYKQLLVGDSTDNITAKEGLSCPNIGEVKAAKALEGCSTEEELFQTTCKLFKQACPDNSVEELSARILLTGQLVKIRQKEGEIWTLPYKPYFGVD